ncbi:MAG: hypothetical protein H7256_11840 [Bdellovibrio sp.]|nr:hypothetical protein [Bdellovibrio sp.]
MNLATTLLLTLSFSVTASAANLFATYEVPAGDQTELIGSNQFRIQQLSLQKSPGGQTSLKYLLPLELTGNPNVIEFTSPLPGDGKTEVVYDNNKMTCAEDTISITCNVAFAALDMNVPVAQKLMSDKFSQKDLEKRLQVLNRFSTDPIGIIRIYKRPILSVKHKY